MSIATELTRLNGNLDALSDAKDDIASAITAKGGTVASGDGLEDFAADIAAIPSGGGDPDENLSAFFNNTITYLKVPTATGPMGYFCDSHVCAYYSLKNWNRDMYDARRFNGFAQNTAHNFVCIGKVRDIIKDLFWNARVQTLVILSRSVSRLTGGMGQERNEVIWVLSSLTDAYKVASNWSQYASIIKGLNEAPSYNASSTYEIGDVCQLNGHFYSYAKRDLTSATGQSPSGTTADNDYWEYLEEVNT